MGLRLRNEAVGAQQGDDMPSDYAELTRTLARAGPLLDITPVDHDIFGAGRWVSSPDHGLLT